MDRYMRIDRIERLPGPDDETAVATVRATVARLVGASRGRPRTRVTELDRWTSDHLRAFVG